MAWGSLESATQLSLSGTYATVQRSAADWEVTLNPGEIAQVMLDFNPQSTPTENCDIIISRTADGTTYESDGEALRYIIEAAKSSAQPTTRRSCFRWRLVAA